MTNVSSLRIPRTAPALVAGLFAGLLCAAAAFARLPPPPDTPEAKAKAAEAAARTAWSAKVDAFQLCQSQDRVAAKYRASAASSGKEVQAAVATPPCSDPGPFAFTPPAEASGAQPPAPRQ